VGVLHTILAVAVLSILLHIPSFVTHPHCVLVILTIRLAISLCLPPIAQLMRLCDALFVWRAN